MTRLGQERRPRHGFIPPIAPASRHDSPSECPMTRTERAVLPHIAMGKVPPSDRLCMLHRDNVPDDLILQQQPS